MLVELVADQIAKVPGGRRLLGRLAFRRSPFHAVSYPKSGRTWLRYMLGLALQETFMVDPDRADLIDIHRMARIDTRVPSIRFTHDDDPHTKRVDELERGKHRYRSKHVLFLARDPRDVIVSSYHQHTKRAPHFGDATFAGEMTEFIRHPAFGIDTVIAFMNIWAKNRSVPRDFLLVRYEDMQEDAARELLRALRFVGVSDPSPDTVRFVSDAASFENMQRLEREGGIASDRLRPTDPDDPDSFKVRRGKVGGFSDVLTAPDRAYVDERMGSLDPLFGYAVR